MTDKKMRQMEFKILAFFLIKAGSGDVAYMCDPKGSLSPNHRLGLARRPRAAPISYTHPPPIGIFMPTPSMTVSYLVCLLLRDREGERVDTRKG